MEPEATFNSLVGDLDYPMFIVTACADGECAGCLIGFATQASIDPSRFLVCLSHKAFLLEPVLAERGTDADEFTFHRAKRIEPGHEA